VYSVRIKVFFVNIVTVFIVLWLVLIHRWRLRGRLQLLTRIIVDRLLMLLYLRFLISSIQVSLIWGIRVIIRVSFISYLI
jgi:hypothetical protein